MSDYSDIIDRPHYQSKKRPHMSMYDRAAQFSPFAALTGYEESVENAAAEETDRMNALPCFNEDDEFLKESKKD